MSWWKSDNKMIPKKKELKVICPYCESAIEKTLFKIVDSVDYEYEEEGYEKREVRLECCPHCKKLLGVVEW